MKKKNLYDELWGRFNYCDLWNRDRFLISNLSTSFGKLKLLTF